MKEFDLREVKKEDCRKIYELSNDTLTRKMAINQEKIKYEDHLVWFNLNWSSLNNKFYVLVNSEDEILGQVRFTIENLEAVVTINLSVDLRGKNKSKSFLKEAIEKLIREEKNINKIVAYIKPENKASINIFESSGFKKKKANYELIRYEYLIIKEIEMKESFIIAEISANHGHNIDIAKKSILEAKNIGANAVKIQTYKAETMTIECDKQYFEVRGTNLWDGMNLYKLYQQAYTPWEWHKKLFEYAKEIGIILFSTPFDKTAVDLLEECGNPIYKIASFEITDIPLIEYIATKRKPIIMSTGIATLEEIEEAVNACKRMGNNDITLLKCTSEYPAKLEDANLCMIQDMKNRFGVKVGVSDHTMGSIVPMTAVALGAEVIEKHFIIDREIGGPDASFSMTPDEFKEMIENVRSVEKTIGRVDYSLTEKKIKSRKFARSLFIVENVKKGEVLTEKNVRSIRPGDGLAPKYYYEILGKEVTQDIEYGTPLSFEMIKR